MNPLLILALVVGGGAGLSMLLRKTNAISQLLIRHWRGENVLPAEYSLTAISRRTVLVDDATSVDLSDNNTVIDVSAPPGTAVRAADDGIVSAIFAQGSSTASKIDSSQLDMAYVGVSSLTQDNRAAMYVGLHYLEVGLGQLVNKGEIIGHVGNTGLLSFYVQRSRMPRAGAPQVNPMQELLDLSVGISPSINVVR